MTPLAIAKKRKKALTEEQVIGYIKAGQKGKDGLKSLRAYGEELGVTAACLNDIYHGRRSPGQRVLDGLERMGIKISKTSRVVVEYQLED